MSSDRTKRRKIQEACKLIELEIHNSSGNLEPQSNSQPCDEHIYNTPYNLGSQSRNTGDLHLVTSSYDRSDTVLFDNDQPFSSDDEEEDVNQLPDLKSDLRKWAITHNITGTATDDLLRILLSNFPNCSLPKSHKTLFGTVTSYNIDNIEGGKYYHFGLAKKIKFYSSLDSFSDTFDSFQLIVGIDGLPISRSSKKQFWPILVTTPLLNFNKPFIVGLYYSDNCKPNKVTEFLEPFVEECLSLARTGLEINGILRKVFVKCIVADAPARNFIKNCVTFNAYHGCDRCDQKGKWLGRVIYDRNDANLRHDQDFNVQLDTLHHTGISPLQSLGIGMVSDVVLDYMHLVCLGVTKKLLSCWRSGPLPHRLGRHDILEISERILACKRFIPSEFNRKPRPLAELEYWKATEYRTFLLYLGPLVLKGILTKEKYEHFMLLSISIRILLSTNRDWYQYARKLLVSFVEKIPTLYVPEFLVYNVHSLIHLSDDAIKFGSLNGINAFPFENFMQAIKRMLRAKNGGLITWRRLLEGLASMKLQIFLQLHVTKNVMYPLFLEIEHLF